MYEKGKDSYLLLKPLERAHHFKRRIEKDGLSASELARSIKKSLSFVSNTLRLLQLPHLVQEGLMSGEISEGHGRALLTSHHHAHIVMVYREILVSNISVRETERMVRKLTKTTVQTTDGQSV